jgi:hypothetical protein
MTDFESLLTLLASAQIEFIIVGGAQHKGRGAPHKPYLRGAPVGLPFRFDES